MFKKIAIFLLVAVLAIGCLCACGSEDDKNGGADTNAESGIKTGDQTDAITAPDTAVVVEGGKLGLSYEFIDGKLYVSGSIEENPGIAGLKLNLTFDPTKVSPVEFTDAEIVSVDEIISNLDQGPEIASKSGAVTVYIVKAENITANGKIFTVAFDVFDGTADAGDMEMGLTVNQAANAQYQEVKVVPTTTTVVFNG